jgi:stress-induced morphogen
MPITAQMIADRLIEHFPGANVKLKDMTGTQDHWDLQIEAHEFTGKSMIQQHQMVYKALGDWMKKEIHALKLQTAALQAS